MFGQLGSIFGGNYHDGSLMSNQNGGQAYNGYNNQGGSALQNNYNSHQAQMALARQYQQHMTKATPKWIIDGKEFDSVREVANELYPTDCPEKTHFILKYE